MIGWYVCIVKSYTKTGDTITVQIHKEPESIYKYSVEDNFWQSKLKLTKTISSKLSDYEEIPQVENLVKMSGNKEVLAETDWTLGNYRHFTKI